MDDPNPKPEREPRAPRAAPARPRTPHPELQVAPHPAQASAPFSLAFSAPVVSSGAPIAGPTAGGTTVVMQGVGLLGMARCRFGGERQLNATALRHEVRSCLPPRPA